MIKRNIILGCLYLSMCALHAQQKSVILSFSAKLIDSNYIALDSVQVQNITKGWIQTLVFPDTALQMFFHSVGMKQVENPNFVLSQNIPNPFDG